MKRPDITLSNPDSIKYHIPFEWGVLRVTHEAARDYELTPFASTIDNDIEPAAFVADKRFPLTLAVTIESPGELLMPSDMLDSPAQSALVPLSRVIIGKKGTAAAVQTGFSMTTRAAREGYTSMLQADSSLKGFIDESIEETLGEPVDSNEIIQKNMQQLMAHLSAGTAGQRAAEAFFKVFDSRRSYNQRRLRLGSFGLWGGGLIVAPAVVNTLAQPNQGVITPAFSIIYGLLAVAGHNYTSNMVDRSSLRLHDAIHATAIKFAGIVGNDIHDTFCKDEFDAKMEKMFES